MKKMLAIVATVIISLTACADNERMVSFADLPAKAQSFVQQYYNVRCTVCQVIFIANGQNCFLKK